MNNGSSPVSSIGQSTHSLPGDETWSSLGRLKQATAAFVALFCLVRDASGRQPVPSVSLPPIYIDHLLGGRGGCGWACRALR
jgi:hypothetical protein